MDSVTITTIAPAMPKRLTALKMRNNILSDITSTPLFQQQHSHVQIGLLRKQAHCTPSSNTRILVVMAMQQLATNEPIAPANS